MAKTDPRASWALAGTQPTETKSRNANITIKKAKVKLRDVAWMMDKLATTQGAGVPVYRALGMLAEMRQKDVIGERLSSMQEMMSEGTSFGAAVRRYEKEFGSLVCALIEAGEASGNLETALERAAELTEARVRLRRKIRGALIYPISVLVITASLIAALLIFVVPRFEDIYQSVGSDLPTMTRILVVLSRYAPALAIIILVLVFAGYLVVRRSRTDMTLRRRLDAFKLRIPITGPLVRKGVNARIASTMSSLLGAGVALLQTIDYAAQAADNLVYADALKEVRQRVNDGLPLSSALTQAPAGTFPPLFIQLSEIGENTGSISELMDKYAKDAEEEVAGTADALTRIIEPLMMVVIGGVVGVFLIGLYLPIIQIGNQIQ